MSSTTSSFFFALAIFLAAVTPTVAHGTITAVTGANGVKAAGFGIIATTPRDGTRRNPFQQDTSVIRDRDIASGKAGTCGRTIAGGSNDVAAQLTAAVSAGLPTTSATGELAMTLHQVNGDGAGPYTCEVSTDGGVTFQAAAVTQNVPGNNGRSRAKATDFPLVMQVAAGTTCAGGPNGNACVARCRNPARAGPFGSCVAFSMGGANAAASSVANNTAGAATIDKNAASSVANNAASSVANNAAGAATIDNNAASSTVKNAAASPTANGVAASNNAAGAANVDDLVDEEEDTTDGGVASAAGAAGNATPNVQEPAASAGTATAGANKKGSKLGGVLGKIFGKAKREDPDCDKSKRKRLIISRVAGSQAGYWIDA